MHDCGISLQQDEKGPEALNQFIDGHVLVVHGNQRVGDVLIRKGLKARTKRVFFVGLVQRQRDRIIAFYAGGGQADLVRRRRLGVRQLDRGRCEVADALVTSHEQVESVFGGGRSGRGDLVKHQLLLSRGGTIPIVSFRRDRVGRRGRRAWC